MNDVFTVELAIGMKLKIRNLHREQRKTKSKSVRQRTGSRFFRGTDPPRRGIQRGRQTVLAEILAAGDCLGAQPVRRGLSQLAKPAGESSVQIRLASLARGISETERLILPIRELVASPRCSVCEQLKAGERSSAQWPLSVPALLDEAGSSAMVREFRQGRQPMLWAHRQYLRLGAGPLKV